MSIDKASLNPTIQIYKNKESCKSMFKNLILIISITHQTMFKREGLTSDHHTIMGWSMDNRNNLLINTCVRSHIEKDYVLTDLLYIKQH